MSFKKLVIPVVLCVLLVGFAVPAQRKKGYARNPPKPLPVVSAIDNDSR